MSRRFEPWTADRISGFLFQASGAALAIIGAVGYRNGTGAALFLVFVGFGLVLLGTARLFRSDRREFGKRFEQIHTAEAIEALHKAGLYAAANVMMSSGGDVDLIARTRHGHLVTIEVKSFRVWNQFLFFKGGRERRAIEQAARQRKAFGAERAIVWLPQGRESLWQAIFGAGTNSVKVVFGGVDRLVRALS